jgi:hypothetical protein
MDHYAAAHTTRQQSGRLKYESKSLFTLRKKANLAPPQSWFSCSKFWRESLSLLADFFCLFAVGKNQLTVFGWFLDGRGGGSVSCTVLRWVRLEQCKI